jgi:hypothetical protein
VLWNSTVNVAEGTVNTVLDAARTNGGQTPLALLDPTRPQVDFSSAKMDYRSEMMRRNLHGKVDGEGIKAGQTIEAGLTIAAPLVVGAATAPKAAPQSLKSLGGIPEVKAVNSVSNTGKAIVDVRKFSEYIFKPNATHGKDIVFKKLGYSERDSALLTEIYQKQAAQKLANGEYTLGMKNDFGQRINIEIRLEAIGEASGKVSYVKSGWMMKDDGAISLNTPFSGFTK